ncbi:hypothetical protein [Methyloterricola oryzae]|uniref:hypothetical protein n=1 Tax=Methyloterricola oryzae TaxID=1495050 RepID=UPI0006992BA5|nr:hypothetical protein [Methyloterricola oryzae]
MGIAYGALKFFFEEGRRDPWRGKVLTLGKQNIAFGSEGLQQASIQYSYALRSFSVGDVASELSDRAFFHALGFSHIDSMDFSNYEGANIRHDLNDSNPPIDCYDAYDLVLDGGTMEHVFHLPNALQCIGKMVRVGGRIIHISPMSNCVDHGFYCFSPTLFVDYYSANCFEIERIMYCRFDKDPSVDPWSCFDYDKSAMGILDAGVYFLMACVRKTPDSTVDHIPIQGYYRTEVWGGGKT